MAVRVLLAAALSAVAMFLWGFIYWGPVLNMTARLTAPLPADAERDVLPPLRAANTPDGMYMYPGPLAAGSDKAAEEAWTKKVVDGPVFHLAYRQGGVSPFDPAMFAKGLGHSFVIALLAGMLLAMVVHALPGYGGRVIMLSLVSLMAAIWTNGDNLIWRFYAPPYTLGQMIYTLVAGLLMAFITAAIVRPRPVEV
jgi:hypothetical protein